MDNKEKVLKTVVGYSKTLKWIGYIIQVLVGLLFGTYVIFTVGALGSQSSSSYPVLESYFSDIDFAHTSMIIRAIYNAGGLRGIVTAVLILILLSVIIVFIIINRLTAIFRHIDKTGKPYDTELLKPLKIILIMACVLSAISPVTLALTIISSIFLYRFYQYGCLLEKDSGQIYVVLDSEEESSQTAE